MKRKHSISMRRIFRSRIFLLTLIALMSGVLAVSARAYYQDYKIRQEIQELQEDVKHLETKKLESMEILKYVISSDYVEDKAREELNMKKPGENVVFITDIVQPKQELGESEKKPVDALHLKNPVKWWYYFNHTIIKSES